MPLAGCVENVQFRILLVQNAFVGASLSAAHALHLRCVVDASVVATGPLACKSLLTATRCVGVFDVSRIVTPVRHYHALRNGLKIVPPARHAVIRMMRTKSK